MANEIYNSFKREIMNGSVDLDTDTIKLMLVTSAYAPNVDTHTKRSDITNEVVGSGYVAGGVTLANKSVSVDNALNKGVFTADPITLPSASITARGGVLYKSRGGLAAADEIIAYADFGADITSTNGDFNISAPILNLL
jgi:hypothetical protein